MTANIEDRLRAAVHATPEALPSLDSDDSLSTIRNRVRSVRRRRRVAQAVVGVCALAAAVVVLLPRESDNPAVRTTGSTLDDSDTTEVTPTVPGTTAPSDGAVAPGSSEPAPSAAPSFGYEPLWPFRDAADVASWQEAYRSGGHQPWHLDAGETALSFTTGYLGFDEINEVVTSDIGATEAYVSVGYETDIGYYSTSAVIHLVRFGAGDDAPWEVVGTRDTDLSLDTPRYGTAVQSPLTVGGLITGVDESLRVQVLQLSSPEPIGEYCCLPAGDVDWPWEVVVRFSGATDPGLTIVVSTGGHYQGVERFAITGVHPA